MTYPSDPDPTWIEERPGEGPWRHRIYAVLRELGVQVAPDRLTVAVTVQGQHILVQASWPTGQSQTSQLRTRFTSDGRHDPPPLTRISTYSMPIPTSPTRPNS